MKGVGSLSRRHALATLAGALACFAGGGPLPARPAGATGNSMPLHARLATLFASPRSVHSVGSACLASRDAATALPGPLIEALMADPSTTSVSYETRRMIEAQIREDFAQGATITVDNWILSRTEAGLCARVACSGGHAAGTLRPS